MNSAQVEAQPTHRAATRQSGWRLGSRLRKTVLLFHIAAGGIWFGLDVAMALLIFTAIGTDSAGVRAYSLQSLQLITVWPMFIAAMLSLITGVLLDWAVSTAYFAIGGWRSSSSSTSCSPR